VKEEPVAIHVNHGPVSASLSQKKEVTVASHQPNYIPWLGYFYKISRADLFVFVDMVIYPGRSYINRNYIKSASGPNWLTIPVITKGHTGQLIRQVETDNLQGWTDSHLKTLNLNYRRATHFDEVYALLEPLYSRVDGERSSLSEFNISLIRAIAAYLGIHPEWLLASDLNVSGAKTDLVVEVCSAAGGTTYLAGQGAKAYLEEEKLRDAGLALHYSAFELSTYPQLFGEFVPNLSIIDVLMNCGRAGTRRLLDLDINQS
jgi:hypothetical protein